MLPTNDNNVITLAQRDHKDKNQKNKRLCIIVKSSDEKPKISAHKAIIFDEVRIITFSTKSNFESKKMYKFLSKTLQKSKNKIK